RTGQAAEDASSRPKPLPLRRRERACPELSVPTSTPSGVTVPAIRGQPGGHQDGGAPFPLGAYHPGPARSREISSAERLTCEVARFPAARDARLRNRAGAFVEGKRSPGNRRLRRDTCCSGSLSTQSGAFRRRPSQGRWDWDADREGSLLCRSPLYLGPRQSGVFSQSAD
ncbi:unnamed protein product, partial [Gulo gulo]